MVAPFKLDVFFSYKVHFPYALIFETAQWHSKNTKSSEYLTEEVHYSKQLNHFIPNSEELI